MLSERKKYMDYLRAGAIIAVIVMHVSGHCASLYEPNTFLWQFFNVFSSVTRWAVPIFVMISGALFLDEEKTFTIKRMYSKYILRLIVAYFFWAIVYAIIIYTLPYYNIFSINGLLNIGIATFKDGFYHLWYIWMLIGLYMIVPLLRKTIHNCSQRELEYWLVISFLISFVIPLLRRIGLVETLLSRNLDSLDIGYLGCYVFYYILGYYLNRYSLCKKIQTVLYILGVICALVTIVGVAILSYYSNVQIDFLRQNNAPNVAIMSAMLFILYKNTCTLRHIPNRVVMFLSKYSFGVYLSHELILSNIDAYILEKTPVIIGMLILIILTVVFSYIISFLLNKIPFLGRYIA